MARSLSDAGAAFIEQWEGSVDHWYRDQGGSWQIGIGHLRRGDEFADVATEDDLSSGRRLQQAEIYDLFRADAAPVVAAVDRLVTVELTQERFDALVDFAFNWGIGETSGFPATSVLRLVNAEDWKSVASELVEGHGPTGRPYDKGFSGVRDRRAAEAAAFLVTPVEIILAVTDDLRALGIPVQFVDGWEDRGRPYLFQPQGAVDHHTATWGYDYDYPSLGIVRDGRSDLPGPLAQFGIGRITGTLYVVAGGYANHAGGGGWNGLSGNGSVWAASEAENDGIGEPISPLQTRTRLQLHASLCRHTGYGPEMISCHREWSDGGKIDPTSVDGDWLRASVAELLKPQPPAPPPAPKEVPELFIADGPDGGIYYTDGATWKRGLPNANALRPWQQGHVPHIGTLDRDYFDSLEDFNPGPFNTGDPAGFLQGPLSQYADEVVEPADQPADP